MVCCCRNDVCRFECNEGFQQMGSSTRVCSSNSLWSGDEAKCIGKQQRHHLWALLDYAPQNMQVVFFLAHSRICTLKAKQASKQEEMPAFKIRIKNPINTFETFYNHLTPLNIIRVTKHSVSISNSVILQWRLLQ